MIDFFKNLLSKFFYKIINSEAYAQLKPVSESRNFELKLKSLGQNSSLPNDCIIKNPHCISIGNGFASMYNLRIEAWDMYRGQKFSPEIIIGNNVIFNTDVHIGCINKIIIGNDVLLASRIYIADHSHGKVIKEELSTPPTERELFSKGPVVIEDRVWIGEGVCVLAGVTIGKGSIIGANAVVTRSIPPNSVAAGIPAKVIKQLDADF